MTDDTRAREPRETVRQREARTSKRPEPQNWQPASLLPNIEVADGYKVRYIRKELLGKVDPTNMSRKVREGWEPCRLEDHPELQAFVDPDAVASGMIEIGGLVACQMPEEMIEQRNQFYASKNATQIQSVDNAYMKENDPRMPLFKERDSKVSFGRGS